MPRQLHPDPFDTTVEPSHYPHLHRMWLGDFPSPEAVAIATQRDGTLRLLPTSSKPLLGTIEPNDGAEEGGQFRDPAPARVPRRRAGVNVGPLVGLLLLFGLGGPMVFGFLRWWFQ